MSLPFLAKKKIAGLIISHRKPDEGTAEDSPNKNDSLEACAADFIDAMQAQDKRRIAAALRAAFEICESEPHEEAGEDGASPHTYESQNQKAGE